MSGNNKLLGILTDAWNGEQEIVEVEYIVEPFSKYSQNAKPNELTLHLIGGVTGFESFVFTKNDDTLERMSKGGWLACAGTSKKYDKLFIPASQMKKVAVCIG